MIMTNEEREIALKEMKEIASEIMKKDAKLLKMLAKC